MTLQGNALPAQDDFTAFALQWLRSPVRQRAYGQRQCDFYAPNVAHAWFQQHDPVNWSTNESAATAMAIETAWDLVRRGLLRPGGNAYPDSNAGDPARFCLTRWGNEWLQQADESHFIMLHPASLAKALAGFQAEFGDGFVQRSQEAMRCLDADAWLATCAMCGAAAESILLALAIAKTGNKDAVIKDYKTGFGRKKTIDLLVGQQPGSIQTSFYASMQLLSYWRDDAAHGMAVTISAPEANEAVRQLLLLCQFSRKNWVALTGR